MRNLTPALRAAILAGTVWPVAFLEVETAGGPQRLWNGIGPLEWDGKSWQGIGSLGQIGVVREVSDVQAASVVYGLSAVELDDPSLDIGEVRNRDRVRFWFGAMTEGGELIADPYLLGNGLADEFGISDDGQAVQVSLKALGRTIKFRRTGGRYYTLGDQQAIDAEDLGGEFVAMATDQDINWGPRN